MENGLSVCDFSAPATFMFSLGKTENKYFGFEVC